MNATYSLLRSKTFYTLLIMSLLPVVNAIVPTLPLGVQNIAEIVLGMLGMYFHNLTAQTAGATN